MGVMENKVDQLLDLVDIEPDALREAEFMQAQAILDTLVGKSVTEATIDETRIVVTTSDGSKYFFYGFLGGGSAA